MAVYCEGSCTFYVRQFVMYIFFKGDFCPILYMCISSICLIFVKDSIFLTALNTAIRVACSFFRCDLLVLYRTHSCYFTLEINRSEQIVSSANYRLLSVLFLSNMYQLCRFRNNIKPKSRNLTKNRLHLLHIRKYTLSRFISNI